MYVIGYGGESEKRGHAFVTAVMMLTRRRKKLTFGLLLLWMNGKAILMGFGCMEK